MEKKQIILKTHGLRNSSEVGIVILPESFYIKVQIYKNGDFEVEFFNSLEEQLFSVCHQVQTVEREPTEEEIKQAESNTASFIANSLAEHLLTDFNVTYDTESYLSRWAAQMMDIFLN